MVGILRFLVGLATTLAVLAVLLAVVAVAVVLEDAPSVQDYHPPTAEDVRSAREFVKGIRAASNATGQDALFQIEAAKVAGTLRLGARFIEDLRATLTIRDGKVHSEISAPVPLLPSKWLNIEATIPEYQNGFAFEQIRLGGREFPPVLAVRLGRVGANVILGDRAGDQILNSAPSMKVSGENIIFELDLDDEVRGDVIQRFFGTMRGADMPSTQEINEYYVLVREAMDRGDLPVEGSYLPYLKFVLQAVLRRSTDTTIADQYTAGLFALAKACGAKDFSLIVGRLAGYRAEGSDDWTAVCDEVTFNGRIDSRRHFTTAAAIQSASNRGFAISIGEFKELYDTISGAGGFDFTDLAANNSGIRMSDYLMTLPIEAWPAALGRMKEEGDVIVSFKDIPGILTGDEFKAQFGNVDSPRYFEMLDQIERKIDSLAVYNGN